MTLLHLQRHPGDDPAHRKRETVSVIQRRNVSGSWPTLLALGFLGLFWSLWGLLFVREVLRWVGAGPEFTSVALGALAWAAVFIGIGIAHLLAALGLRAGRGWAIVLAAVLALIDLGAGAHWLLAMTVDSAGRFDIETVSVWRFSGWQVIGIFGLLLLAVVVILVAVARVGRGHDMTSE